jgi:CRP-like cAMP-binding protein
LLSAIPDHEIEDLAKRATREDYARGDILVTKRDGGHSVMFVAKGRVKIVGISPTGSEVIHNIIDEGEVFGEMALLDGKNRSADAIAATDSNIVEFTRDVFLDILRRNPEATIQMMLILCGRIRQSTAFVEDAGLLDSSMRLLNRLKALADQYGIHEANRTAIRIPHQLSQQELGESVGLTRVSINRMLVRWREAGWIRDGRGVITVIGGFADLEASIVGNR